MAGAAGAASGAASGQATMGGNPFQLATNLYAEKNNVGIITAQAIGAAQFPTGGQINAGQYLRGLRLIVRTQTAGVGAVTLGATVSDYPWNILTQVDLVNVDGSEILYVMGGYAHYIAQKYGRPWLGDPQTYADAAAATATIPQFTLFLQPEVRWTAGCLANPLALDTPVETRTGWKRIDEVVAGDEILGSDHRWTPCLGVSEVFIGRDCYRLTIGDEQIVCDGEHRWPTTDAHGVAALRTTAELAKGGAYQITGHEKITSIEPVASVPTKCIATGRDDHLFLVGRTHIPTRNTDTRSQYRYDAVIDTTTNIVQGGSAWATSTPILSVTPYMDSWAQPDASDLQGTPNQPVPPGLNLQFKRRHQIFTLNAGGSDNIMQSALTGNALRNQILVTRTSAAGANRIEALTDPLLWQIDNRSLGKISINRPSAAIGSPGGDLIGVWDSEQYIEYFTFTVGQSTVTAGLTLSSGYARETGVYVFPRYLKPGSLYGQGWLYTANSTKEIFESSSAAGLPASSTAELISDEVYPVGPVDPQLTDI